MNYNPFSSEAIDTEDMEIDRVTYVNKLGKRTADENDMMAKGILLRKRLCTRLHYSGMVRTRDSNKRRKTYGNQK